MIRFDSVRAHLPPYCTSTEIRTSTESFLLSFWIQVNDDDHVASLLQEVIVLDYQHQQGHELLMHVLYHLHSRVISESIEQFSVDDVYEKLLLKMTNSLLETLPASDKSFSRLLGEAPVLTNSVLELLDKICCSEGSDQRGKDKYDGDRVTQGLGAAWSLILGRPLHRITCLNIALKIYAGEVWRNFLGRVQRKSTLRGKMHTHVGQYITVLKKSIVCMNKFISSVNIYGSSLWFVADPEFGIYYILSVKCDVRGDLGPSCNSATMIDRLWASVISHLYTKPVYRNFKECNKFSDGKVQESSPSFGYIR